MILPFEPPPELLEFVWRAAQAAAAVTNRESDPHAPMVLPTQVLGSHRFTQIVRARRIMVLLISRHVRYDRVQDAGTCHLEIVIDLPPQLSRPISLPMIGFLLLVDHSSFPTNRIVCSDDLTMTGWIEAADRELIAMYGGHPVRITREVTFRGKLRARRVLQW